MPAPDFSKGTIDVLARRARFQCSNPDCGVHTTGPNADPGKATTIGEAAHIMGAQPGAARYKPSMTDATRAEVTNGIWLCRNCHGKVDRDPAKHPAELLFAWRMEQEARAARELGTRGERVRHEIEMARLDFLSGFPPIVQRIAIDKPEGWEYRFTAELMRYLNNPQYKRLRNLQGGHYYNPQPRIPPDQFVHWMQERMHVMSNIVSPLEGLMTRLTASWGPLGEEGDVEEIHDVCILIRDALKAIVDFEESLHFAHIPEEGEPVRSVVMNSVGPNVLKLVDIPDRLDSIVATIGARDESEGPTTIQWTLVFELPGDFSERFHQALVQYEREASR